MERAGKTTVRLVRLVFLVVLVTTGVVACGGSSAPPGASKALGSCEQGGYLFLRWQEGLEVMLWHVLTGEGTASSVGFAAGQFYIERGSARAVDGRSLAWEVQTTHGALGEAQIAGVRYDLAAGTLFLVTTLGGETEVKQLSRDLSAVPVDHDGILAFARNDPDVAAFLNEAPPVTPTPSTNATSPPPTPSATFAPAATPLPPTLTPTAMPVPPIPASTAAPLPPTLMPVPAPAIQRIRFVPGATQAQVEGYLPVNGRALFVLGVAAGQFVEMNAAVGATDQGLCFSIIGADGSLVKPMGEARVRTVVPSTQDYYVYLVSDVGATSYRLSVLIPARIRFAPGATSATVTGGLEGGQVRHYVLRALAGQRMLVAPHTTVGQVGLVIWGADGQVLSSGRVGQLGGEYEGILPMSQDYLISVQAKGGIGADYTLEITIPPPDPFSTPHIQPLVEDSLPHDEVQYAYGRHNAIPSGQQLLLKLTLEDRELSHA